MSYLSTITDSYGNVLIKNDLSSLEFGGNTSSFPALKANGTSIAVQLADGSAPTALSASVLTLSNDLVLQEQSSSPATISGYGQIFAKNDGYIYFVNPTGTTAQIITTNSPNAGITALTGDVVASGTGTVAATVEFVDGVSSTNVANAANIVNSASTNGYVLTANGSAGGASFQPAASSGAQSLSGDVTGTISGTNIATTVAHVDGYTAAQIATGSALANAATNLDAPLTIVLRDSSGNFSAGTITATLSGNASTATSATTAGSATNFTGSLSGDVTGTQGSTVVSYVDGYTAVQIATGSALANAATNLDTPSTLVLRDSSGNFSAGTITATLNGNASTATSSTNFSGSLSGDVTGTQSATVVSKVDGYTALQVGTATAIVNAASTSGYVLTANGVSGGASYQPAASSGAQSLSGDVTGTISGTNIATTVAHVDGYTAVQIATGAALANAATNTNSPSTLVLRDSSGNFSAGTITAALTGTASGNLALTGGTLTGSLTGTSASFPSGVTANITGNISGSAASFTSSLSGDVTGTQGATVVSHVDGYTALQIGTGAALANAAINTNTPSTIVLRDSSGNFSAGTITASLTGHASLDLALTGGTVSGATTFSASGTALSVTNNAAMGGLILNGSTSGTLTQDASATTTSYSITWPASQGAANSVLTNNGSGTLTWSAPTSSFSTITLGNGSAPSPSLNFSNSTSTGFYSISSGSVGFSSGGALSVTFGSGITIASGGTLVVSGTGGINSNTGSVGGLYFISAQTGSGAGSVNYSIGGAQTTGLYGVAGTSLGLSVNGTSVFSSTGSATTIPLATTFSAAATFSASGTALSVTNAASVGTNLTVGGVTLLPNGSASAPSYSFTNATSTGMFYDSTNTALGFALGGTYTAGLTYNSTNAVASLDFKGGTDSLGALSFMTATPSGNLTGSVGDVASWTGGSAGTVLYVKESGSSTTTGWANVFTSGTSNAIASTALSGTGSTTGYVLVSTGTGTSPTWQAYPSSIQTVVSNSSSGTASPTAANSGTIYINEGTNTNLNVTLPVTAGSPVIVFGFSNTANQTTGKYTITIPSTVSLYVPGTATAFGNGTATTITTSVPQAYMELTSIGSNTYLVTRLMGTWTSASGVNLVGSVIDTSPTAGYVLTENGSGSAPTFQAAPGAPPAVVAITSGTSTVSSPVNNTTYINTGSGVYTIDLPTNSATTGADFRVKVINQGTGSVVLRAATSQVIYGGNQSSSAAGSATSSTTGAAISIVIPATPSGITNSAFADSGLGGTWVFA